MFFFVNPYNFEHSCSVVITTYKSEQKMNPQEKYVKPLHFYENDCTYIINKKEVSGTYMGKESLRSGECHENRGCRVSPSRVSGARGKSAACKDSKINFHTCIENKKYMHQQYFTMTHCHCIHSKQRGP